MKASANGIDIRYEISGSGPWVMLSHSLACDLTMWDEQLASLEERYTVLRYDTRGHGGSSAPLGPYTLEQLADDTIALLDTLGVPRTHFVGLSMGGTIAQHVALKARDRIASLLLADTTSRYPREALAVWQERIRIVSEQGMEPMVQPTLERWFTAPYRASHPHVMERIGGLIRGTSAAGYVGCCHAIPNLNLSGQLGGLDLPTLVLVGEQDAGTPVAMAQEVAAAIPGARLEIIPNAAHLSNIEQAPTFNALLREFLDAQP
jgi:3-oxoadipate enol-lactonase